VGAAQAAQSAGVQAAVVAQPSVTSQDTELWYWEYYHHGVLASLLYGVGDVLGALL
jgi:hypothetical protein